MTLTPRSGRSSRSLAVLGSTILIILSHVTLFLNKRRSTSVVEARESPDYKSDVVASNSQTIKDIKFELQTRNPGRKTGIPIQILVINTDGFLLRSRINVG